MKGGWPTKDERVHERVTGYEGTSQWTPLFVRTGETGKWHSKLRRLHQTVNDMPLQLTLSFYWQKNAKAHAEQIYRNKLKKAGLKEQFVQENGEAAEKTSTSSISEDDTDKNEIDSRYAEWTFLAFFIHYAIPLRPVNLWIALVLESQGLHVVWSYYIT